MNHVGKQLARDSTALIKLVYQLCFVPLLAALSLLGFISLFMPLTIAANWDSVLHWFIATFAIIFATLLFLYFLSYKNRFQHFFSLLSIPGSLDLKFISPKAQHIALIKAFTQMTDCIENRDNTLKLKARTAESANRAKSNFLVSISHELRTPMHAILNFSEMGQRHLQANGDDKLLVFFQRINESGNRLLKLIDQLLDLTKLEAGKTEFHFASADIIKTIDDVVTELESLLKAKNITVKTEYFIRTPNIIFDREHIIQVLVNLLSNAIKYTPENTKITIDITNSTLALSYGDVIPAVCVSISDRGNGIPEGELESIFNKFTQSTATRPGSGGTGIGLAICKEIIQAHNGKLWAENLPKKGAKFVFIIPESYSTDCTIKTLNNRELHSENTDR